MSTSGKNMGNLSKGRRKRAGRVVAVDLFCGAGGKTHGFLRGGIEVAAGVDVDPTCRFPYEHNNAPASFFEKSVADLTVEEVASWYPSGSTRVLIGCAPCQPFSIYSYRYGAGDGRKQRHDKRWGLLHAFRDLVAGLLPEIVTVENVPELTMIGRRPYEAFIEGLSGLGYHVDARVVKCARYGIPQTRERLVVLASRFGPIELIPPTHEPEEYVSVRDAIGDLPPITAGGPPPDDDPVHRACRLSPMNLRRVRATPEGGGWQDWPMRLRLPCHRRDTGKTYPSVYGRMKWDDLAPTLTTQCFGLGNGRFGHPEQDRAISLREAALLQTFPPEYVFVEPGARITFKHVGRHIGNAVPARLGEVIALSIKKHLLKQEALAVADETSRRRDGPRSSAASP
jgi:DNA (cytosine-5)-methyltransferase 1